MGFASIALLILGVVAMQVLGRLHRTRQRLRLREMAHRERVLALERGLPIPEDVAGVDDDAWLDVTLTARLLERGWDRRVTLGVGLVMLFASTGALLFAWLMPPVSPDAVNLKIAAGLGVIPLMASFGMLLYYRLTTPEE